MGVSKKARLEGQKKMGMIVQVSLFPTQNWCRIVGRPEVERGRGLREIALRQISLWSLSEQAG